jgi:hypothetical protein
LSTLTRWVLSNKRLVVGFWLAVAIAAVALLGRWSWWLPRRPARLLGVEPSRLWPEPAAEEAAR